MAIDSFFVHLLRIYNLKKIQRRVRAVASKRSSMNDHVYGRVQAPVVQKLDSAIHQINHYPADTYYGKQLRYPLDSDLSAG